MQFLYPGFLFALSLISIPIIIHLFNFRRFKKIYFTNVKFLKEIKEETSSQSKLKHFLVLLSRILAVLFLVFAFAQPYFPAEDKKIVSGENAVSVYVDNSFSMESVTREGTLLDESKKKHARLRWRTNHLKIFNCLPMILKQGISGLLTARSFSICSTRLKLVRL